VSFSVASTLNEIPAVRSVMSERIDAALELKLIEDKQNQVMHQLYDELDALERNHKP
jgi:hypothetical protein